MFLYHEKNTIENIIGQWKSKDCLEGATFAEIVKEDFFFKEVRFKLRPG